MNTNAFAKGEALAKLIELIGKDKKALVNKDAELGALIDEVREMFKSDEQTITSHDELLALIGASGLEPGHKYYVADDLAYVTAASTSALEPFAIKGPDLVVVNNSLEYSAVEFGGSNELTECSLEEINALIKSNELIPGHKYKVRGVDASYEDGFTFPENHDVTVTANSTCTLERIGFSDGGLVVIKPLTPVLVKDFDYEIDVVDGIVGSTTYDIHYFFGDGKYDGFTGKLKSNFNIGTGKPHWTKGLIASPDELLVNESSFVGLEYTKYDDIVYSTEFGISDYISVNNIMSVIYYLHDNFIGTKLASSVANLPVDKSTVDVRVSANGTLSWSEGLEDGKEVLALIKNIGDSKITIILPDGSNQEWVEIPAGGSVEASVVAINGTYLTRIASNSVQANDDFFGTNEVSDLANLPVNKSSIKADVSTNQTLSWSEGLAAGRDVLCVIHNTSSSEITIGLPDNCNVDSIKIKAGEYGEVSLASLAGSYYTRAAVEETISGEANPSVEYEEITAEDVIAMFNGTYVS